MSHVSTWEEIVTEPTPLREMIVEGNGKDCDLTMTLPDGRRIEMPVNDVTTVLADGAVRVDIDGPGDCSLRIRYSGPGLEIRSARVGITGGPDPEKQAEFREVVRKWLLGEDRLWWTADAEITLASAARHGEAWGGMPGPGGTTDEQDVTPSADRRAVVT